MSAFVHGESALALALGVPESLLSTARKKMRATVDWGTLPDGRVAYATEALKPLALLVTGENLAASELEALSKKTRADEGTIPARVARLFRNPHVIEVRLPDETAVNVRVRHTDTLRAGDGGTVLQVQRTVDGRYELAQRLPRSVRRGFRHETPPPSQQQGRLT